ncbi:MAG: MFS transporter [Myxococcota bacterium]
MQLSVVDGVLHAIMVGVAESYLGALAVELGHDDRALALLTTVPLLSGALAQLGAGALATHVGGTRRFVVAGATLQALCLSTFIGIAWFEVKSLLWLLLAKVAFWCAGSVIAPAWGSWMGRLTEHIRRERYFAWRSSIVQLVLLGSFTSAGALLARHTEGDLRAFAALHLVGLSARLLSALALSQKADIREERAVEGQGATAARTEGSSLAAAIREANWRVPLYMAMLMLFAHVSVPFYTPYMLRELKLDYLSFAALTSVSILAKALVFPLLHPLAARFGLRTVLASGGLGISFVATSWAYVTSVPGLAAVQALSGASWGALEFASFQLLLHSAKADIRLPFLSLASCLQGVAQLSGALLGSVCLDLDGVDYRGVFLVSGIGRALALLALVRLDDVHRVRSLFELIARIDSVRPGGGAMRRLWPRSRS